MGGRKKLQEFYQELIKMLTWSHMKDLIVNPKRLPFVSVLIITAELIINLLVVERVPYTEIDWKAYMQECEGFLNGTFDYGLLRGDTGPLVYPAGFVYIYSFFYFLTNQGENIKLAQYIFIGIYLLQLCLVLRIYIKTRKVPPYVLVITILTSYRIHSIYVLRLFNDPVAVLFLYIALNLFMESKWHLGSIFYSLGVSIKMNILLYAPALFFFYLVNLGFKGTIIQLFICGLIQVVIGMPFLLTNPRAYLKGSFDLGRVFNHTWTVNYRFLDIPTFENKCFHLSLLGVHVLLLIIFIPMCVKYFKSYCRLRYVQHQFQPQIDAKNLENKRERKYKVKRDIKQKLTKELNKNNDNKEILTKEQEDFLYSFETMLHKTSGKCKKLAKKPIPEPPVDSNYSIDFGILTQLFILPMFIVNFIGVTCARSLHYQFYSWYFHSLPYLLWSNNYSVIVRFLILALIEMCWNTYPSTQLSSALLHACHICVLYGIYQKITGELKIVSKIT